MVDDDYLNSTDKNSHQREVSERGIIKDIHRGNRLTPADFDCRASVEEISLKK